MRELHEKSMKNVRGQHASPGQFEDPKLDDCQQYASYGMLTFLRRLVK
jgi:hypothetical protein